jgi:3-methylfumaryl-CoA hydratase
MSETNLQDWVGRTSTAIETADGERAARLATLLGHDGDPVAPLFPLGHWLHFSEDDVPMSDLGTDGHAALGGFMPPVPLPRRMWAGSDLTFHTPILPGQTIERTTTIESITEKTGSTGPLCFVVLRHELTADGKPATTDRHTIVYREATSVPEGSAAKPPREDSLAPGRLGLDALGPTERGHALPLLGVDVQLPPHPLRPPVRHRSRRLPRARHAWTIDRDAAVGRVHVHPPRGGVTEYRFTAKSPLFANEQIHLVGRETEPGTCTNCRPSPQVGRPRSPPP